ncbi:MAG: hypothetical protein JJT95_09480 [Pararhodobacter sp.]|nr:hypothetical protein [Pararhodobacter sp.]
MTPRIVTFCNAGYIPVVENWLRALDNIEMDDRAIVVSLDDSTRDAFPAGRVLHRPLPPGAQGLGALWSHRIAVLRELLSTGEAVIHSDADAVWLRDPIPDIDACATPIVFTQGTFWPPDVHARRGLVLCCGFFFLRPDPQVFRFLDAVAARMSTDRDDQIAMNRVVDAWIDDWKIDNPYRVSFRDIQFIASRMPIRAHGFDEAGNEVAISVLPHHAYPRILDSLTQDTVVAHPLSGKSRSEKERCLRRLGLWVI